MITWTLVLIGGMIIANAFIGKGTILYPPFAFTCIWFLVISFYASGIVEMYSLHAITYICITLACLAFTCGGTAAFLLPDWTVRSRFPLWSREQSTGTGRKTLLLLLLFFFPIYLFLLHRIGTSAGSFSLANVKASQVAALTGEASEQSTLATLYPLFVLWTALILYLEKSDRASTLAIFTSFIVSLLSGGRTIVLQLIISIAYTYLIRTGKNSIRKGYKIVLIAGGGFLALASALVFFVKNMEEVGNDASTALQFYVLGYVVSGLGPLDYVLTHPAEYLHTPHHTFKFLLQFGAALGLDTNPPPVLDQYLWIPFPTNVYTMLKPYITDFGFYGMLASIFILALIQVAFYRRALQGNRLSILLSGLLFYATILSFFDDLYVQVKNFGLPILLAIFYFGVLNQIKFRNPIQWSLQNKKAPYRICDIHFTLFQRWPKDTKARWL